MVPGSDGRACKGTIQHLRCSCTGNSLQGHLMAPNIWNTRALHSILFPLLHRIKKQLILSSA